MISQKALKKRSKMEQVTEYAKNKLIDTAINKTGKFVYNKTIGDRGLVAPGKRYFGPLNSLHRGKPTNYNDFIALIHDRMYQQLEKKGVDVYTQHNIADDFFLKYLKPKSIIERVGYGYFKGKKVVAGKADDEHLAKEISEDALKFVKNKEYQSDEYQQELNEKLKNDSWSSFIEKYSNEEEQNAQEE